MAWPVLIWALFRFEAFVFVFGETITNSALELWLLRLFKRRTVMVYLGSDARPAYLDGALHPVAQPFDPKQASLQAHQQATRLQRIEARVDIVVNARATGHFHRRRFVNWFALGIPRSSQLAAPQAAGDVLRVLHCPSHLALKGTQEIKDAVARLQSKGLNLDLNLIQGKPNSEVMAALMSADLVIDQLYSDTPMAAFATEAASRGRPVIVGSELAGQMANVVAPMACPPTLCIRPEELEFYIESLASNPIQRAELAQAGQSFVAAEWSPQACAERLMRLIRGDIPDAWWCDPGEVTNTTGCGLRRIHAQQRLRALLAWGGRNALAMNHNPALQERLVTFAQEDQL